MKKNNRILIAESEQIIAADLQLMLENAGQTIVATTTTGEETIEKVKELEPDILILDIYLNGKIDGKTAAKKIQELGNTSITLYSTRKDILTITDELIINQNKNKQIISKVKKVKIADVFTKEIIKKNV